jgi:hypothetical protein
MKKPFIHVTKWLGDIPVEAECAACPSAEKFRAVSTSHRPNRAEYQKALQRAFDQHIKTAHMGEDARDAPIAREATERDS